MKHTNTWELTKLSSPNEASCAQDSADLPQLLTDFLAAQAVDSPITRALSCMAKSSAVRSEASHVSQTGHETRSVKKRKLEDVQNGCEPEGETSTKSLSKQERREAKRLKRLGKEEVQQPQETNGEHDKIAEAGDVDAKAAKKARKAEKARLKAEKQARKEAKSEHIHAATNGETKQKPGKERGEAAVSNYGYDEDAALTRLPQSDIDAFLTNNAIAIQDPSSTSPPLRPITNFSYLPTSATSGKSPFGSFNAPTPIQAAAWPSLLSGRDVIGVAETGSGKTLAFGVPLVRFITTSKSAKHIKPAARALVVSPTRELAVQIHTQLESLAAPAGLKAVCVYGAHIIVATPGRINDLIQEGSADLSRVNYLVLDEADRMLDKGFEDAIRTIISTCSYKDRQTLMFTATWPPSVRELASTFMTKPVHISIGENNPTGELRANKSITQLVEVLDPYDKQARLLQLLKKYAKPKDRILIFALYKKEAARIEDFIRRNGYSVAGIHGDMSQPARSASLEGFKSGQCPLLVATDVAARGLDIPAVKVVINLTFPLTVEDYVHRIGRTGRAGKEGLAVTLFTDHDKPQAGGLINVLKAAGQEVPDELLKYGTTVKKKGHEAYGAFYKDLGPGEKKEGTKIRF